MRFLPYRKSARIAFIDVSGSITDNSSINFLVELQKTPWKKNNIVALVVRICSSGGSLGAAQSMAEGISTVRDEAGIPTICLVSETALSAAFYLALSCDIVVFAPGATVGGVGAIMPRLNLHELAGKMGIACVPIQSGSGKSILHPLSRIDPARDAVAEQAVLDLSAQFIDWIVERRGTSENVLAQITDGRILSGRQSFNLGLADEMGGFFPRSESQTKKQTIPNLPFSGLGVPERDSSILKAS
jgi:signal peptide peptidase SppA